MVPLCLRVSSVPFFVLSIYLCLSLSPFASSSFFNSRLALLCLRFGLLPISSGLPTLVTLSLSLSLSLYLFLPFLVPRLPVVLSRGTFPPTESRRVIYLIFEIQPVLFSSMGLHTLRWLARLPSSRGSRAILRLPWDERDTGMIANQRVRLEREREKEREKEREREREREWVEFQAPRGGRTCAKGFALLTGYREV